MNYHAIIDGIFDYCVDLLIIAAHSIGMTYEEINVWFFIVFEPLVFAMVALYAWRLKTQNMCLRRQLEPISHTTHSVDSGCTGYLLSSRTS